MLKWVAIAGLGVLAGAAGAGPATTQSSGTTRPSLADDFQGGLSQWVVEREAGGKVEAKAGVLEIDVPGGATVWFKPMVEGPAQIEFIAEQVSAGGANDRVSDLNMFWMATDSRSPKDLFATTRAGKFAEYDQLKCYYVGFGGNSNTTTRFRRYIGEKANRPLLPEHDLKDQAHLLVANHPYKIKLVADGKRVEFWRDGEKVFGFEDAEPYVLGHFAIRTVTSHLRISEFRITSLR